MNNNIQILIATTSSMLLTFVLDCVLLGTSAYDSLIQQFVIDICFDFNLVARCWYDGHHSNYLKNIILILVYEYLYRFCIMYLSFD